MTISPPSGPAVEIDEDGCCLSCGATATGTALDALPSLAAVLGELAVAREALRRRGHEQECPEFDYDAEPDCCACGWTAALDAPAGKLAAEVLREAVYLRASCLRGVEPFENDPTREFMAAVDAFLAAFPSLAEKES